MNTRSLLIAGGIAGVLMGLFSTLPFISVANCCACLWLWSGGILSVYLYRRLANEQGPLALTQGALIGMVAGLVSAIIGALIEAFVGPYSWEIIGNLLGQVEGIQDTLSGPLELFAAKGGFSFLTLVMNLLVYTFFGVVGGILGTLIFKGKQTAAA
ncbi:MAG: hypothetical protein MUE67_12200 [Anaerolineales bacterium]|jgi:hypothetical protein|nr:hypothetical protein [Anaerolineales bacterium]